jgi:hypothetical protein
MGLETLITVIGMVPVMAYAVIAVLFMISKIFYAVFKSTKIPRREKNIIIFISSSMFLLFSVWFYWGISILTKVL